MGALGMARDRRCEAAAFGPRDVERQKEDTASMVRPVTGGAPTGVVPSRAKRRADLAMDILTYGAAVLAIVVVTLLSGVR